MATKCPAPPSKPAAAKPAAGKPAAAAKPAPKAPANTTLGKEIVFLNSNNKEAIKKAILASMGQYRTSNN